MTGVSVLKLRDRSGLSRSRSRYDGAQKIPCPQPAVLFLAALSPCLVGARRTDRESKTARYAEIRFNGPEIRGTASFRLPPNLW
ncbi:hypothetical protein ARMSODRAFT_355226 [Armillaria solidipes]|uniref:Uncharacterized protein n=1 Tax=Armillaria solidipes TaxID=1076256 RepID=A0A2H3BQW4_9AGAR|nr:hypothetical protein ARMSODRAFT_355226 [Armillaria solidipes]